MVGQIKPLRINTKGTKLLQYLKPIPEFIDKFGVPFPTAQQAADGWVKSFAAIEGGEVTTNLSEASRRSTKETQVKLSTTAGWNNGGFLATNEDVGSAPTHHPLCQIVALHPSTNTIQWRLALFIVQEERSARWHGNV